MRFNYTLSFLTGFAVAAFVSLSGIENSAATTRAQDETPAMSQPAVDSADCAAITELR
jgi:hypothetical protein